jgi:dienelactone hydrolase
VRRFVWIVALLASCAGSAAAAPPYRNPTAGSVLVYQIPGMHLARVTRDVVYRRVGGESLRMDVYHPRSWHGPALPAVIIGGPPAYGAGKDSGQKVGWSQLVAASGLAAVAFDIRSDNFLSTPRDPASDVAAAITFLRRNAARLGVDGDRLCTLGFSLGTAPWHLWAAMHERQPWIRCNVDYYGPPDLTRGFQIGAADAREFSALTYLRRDGASIAPLLIAKAARDQFAEIPRSIDRFAAAARAVHAPVRVLTHPAGPHGFDLEKPGPTSRRIIAQTLAFLRARLA